MRRKLILLGILGFSLLVTLKANADGPACLIIYPEKYTDQVNGYFGADTDTGLKQLIETLGIETVCVKVEDIGKIPYGATNFKAILPWPDALTLEGGFGNHGSNTDGWTPISTSKFNFNYTGYGKLPLQITTFIQDTAVRNDIDLGRYYYPDLQYIILFGNSSDIPPSYYVYQYDDSYGVPYGARESWIPTDYFYSLANYSDLIPNFSVGRLPIKDIDGASMGGTVAGIIEYTRESGASVDNGTASNVTNAYVEDTTKKWIPNEFVDGRLEINGIGSYYITSNTDTQIYVTGTPYANGAVPGSGYSIYDYRTELTVNVTPNNSAWVRNQYQNDELIIYVDGIPKPFNVDYHDAKYSGDPGIFIIKNKQLKSVELVEPDDPWEISPAKDEAWDIVNKLRAWFVQAQSDPTAHKDIFKKIAFAGGNLFNTWLYWGELACLDIINATDPPPPAGGGDGKPLLSGMNVTKYFTTNLAPEKRFIRDDILNIFNGTSDKGFMYLVSSDESSRNTVGFDAGPSLTVADLKDNVNSDSRYPVVFSTGGNTAGFDSECYGPATTSIGEGALLSSNGGAIAFFGPNRASDTLVKPEGSSEEKTFGHYLDGGGTDTGTINPQFKYLPELYKMMFAQYHRKGKNLDTIFRKAQADFVNKYGNGTKMINQPAERALFTLTLLGIPPLPIPEQEPYVASESSLPTVTPKSPRPVPDSFNEMNMPVYEVLDGSSKQISFDVESASTDVEIHLVDPRSEVTHERVIKTPGSNVYNFSFDDVDGRLSSNNRGPSIYFLRVSPKESNNSLYQKERRVYVETVNEFKPTTNPSPSVNILVVDNDEEGRFRFRDYESGDNERNYEGWYREALKDNLWTEGTDFKIWFVDNDFGTGNVIVDGKYQGRHGAITNNILLNYLGQDKIVIFFTGDNRWDTLKELDMTRATTFLNSGGKLFITGQNIAEDIVGFSFLSNYLKASFIQDEVKSYEIDGLVADSVSSGFRNININPEIEGGARNQNSSDEIDPSSGGSTAFVYHASAGPGAPISSGSAGVRYYNEEKESAEVFLSFGFEGIQDRTTAPPYRGRQELMKSVIDWLRYPSATGNFTATTGNEYVDLNWTVPTTIEATGVRIRYRTDGMYPQNETDGEQVNGDFNGSPGNPGNYRHVGLTNGITYYYKAFWYNTGKTVFTLFGFASATPNKNLPSSPEDLSATPGIGCITLSWKDTSDNENGFRIWRRTSGEDFTILPFTSVGANGTGNVQYLDENVTADIKYYYYVKSYNVNGESAAASNIASATPYAETSTGGGGGGGCFIATVAFGSPLSGCVETLRQFRDRYLLSNTPGRAFIRWYNRHGPAAAKFIEPHPVLKAVTRYCLYPPVFLSYIILNGLFLPFLILIFSVIPIPALVKSRRKK